MPLKKKRIGQVTVDSGMLMILDPCYLFDDNITDVQSYNDILELHIKESKPISFKKTGNNAGVLLSTQLGDGIYDVHLAEFGGTKGIFIELTRNRKKD
jgi:hypothetical protein